MRHRVRHEAHERLLRNQHLSPLTIGIGDPLH
jgi:hypothetical protein